MVEKNDNNNQDFGKIEKKMENSTKIKEKKNLSYGIEVEKSLCINIYIHRIDIGMH